MSDLKLFTPPNFVTLANLACGFFGIQQALAGHLDMACYCIYLAAIFDFLDGFVSRLFKASSELGKQLDSICDAVSFGVLPGFIFYGILEEYKWLAVCVPLFSTLRLAKFNLDTRQSDNFIGVPTPINALFIASISFIFAAKIFVKEINYLLIALLMLSSVMLVVELPLISLKFKGFGLKENLYRYLLLLISLVFLIILQQESFFAIYFVYIILSVIRNIQNRSK